MADVTTTKTDTLQAELDLAEPNKIADALRKVKPGHMLSVVKAVITSLTAATVVDLTAAATKAAAVVTGLTLATGENLPAIGSLLALRVVGGGGGNKPGMYIVTDKDGTPYDAGATAVGVASLSDDGKTLTFNAQVTAFTIEYMPRSAADTQASFT